MPMLGLMLCALAEGDTRRRRVAAAGAHGLLNPMATGVTMDFHQPAEPLRSSASLRNDPGAAESTTRAESAVSPFSVIARLQIAQPKQIQPSD